MKSIIKWEQDSNESITRMDNTTNSVVESNENIQSKTRTNNSAPYREIQSLNGGITDPTSAYRQSLNQNSELHYRVRQSPSQRIFGETELPALTVYQVKNKIVYTEASSEYASREPEQNVKPSASFYGLSSNRVPRAHLDSNSRKTFAKSNDDEKKSISFKTIEDSEFSKNIVGRPTRIRTPVRENMRSTVEYAKGRKKGTSDDRWGKRFIWPDDLHSDFVSAIFDIGLKQSSPSIIFETMVDKKGITLADIKNHLQKYQLYRSKSKQGFQPNLDQSIEEVATVKEKVKVQEKLPIETGEVPKSKPNLTILIPKLTDEEKISPIGNSLGYLLGLFFSLRQQLLAQRPVDTSSPNIQALPFEQKGIERFENMPVTGSLDPEQDSVYKKARLTYAQDHRKDVKVESSLQRTSEYQDTLRQHMNSQKKLQGRLRDLKEREFNSCYYGEDKTENRVFTQEVHSNQLENEYARDKTTSTVDELKECGDHVNEESTRPRGLSDAISEEFWNNEVIDDQLFEFLLEH